MRPTSAGGGKPNILEGKKLTNIRAAGKDEAVRLTPPMKFTLEKAMAYHPGESRDGI